MEKQPFLKLAWKRGLQIFTTLLSIAVFFGQLTFTVFVVASSSFIPLCWPFLLIYPLWVYFDNRIIKTKTRRNEWIRKWRIFQIARNYHPINLITDTPDLILDPKKNYLFVGFPDVIYPRGAIVSLLTNACGVDNLFPQHKVFAATLGASFYIPLYREIVMGLGAVRATEESLRDLLSESKGGNIVFITPGGVAEAYPPVPEKPKTVNKEQMQFIKLALQTGSPLVPVYSFGATYDFDRYLSFERTLLQRFQDWLKHLEGPAITIFNFGAIPRRTPINVIIGEPIEVEKKENPTESEIGKVYQTFIRKLEALFETNKRNYIENAIDVKLVTV